MSFSAFFVPTTAAAHLYRGSPLVADEKQGQGKSLVLVFGAPGGTRTRDLLIRSQGQHLKDPVFMRVFYNIRSNAVVIMTSFQLTAQASPQSEIYNCQCPPENPRAP